MQASEAKALPGGPATGPKVPKGKKSKAPRSESASDTATAAATAAPQKKSRYERGGSPGGGVN